MKGRTRLGFAGLLGLVLLLACGPLRAQEVPAGGEDRISISFTEASIQDVLRSLAAMRDGVNIVVEPGVTGLVSFQLEDVPWDTALKLVTDMHGLVITKENENIFRVGRARAIASADLAVELHTAESIALLTDEEVLNLVADPSLGPEDARAFLTAEPKRFVSRIVAENQPAVDIVNELARQAGLNFAFSSDFEAPAAKPGEPVQPRVLPPVSINLRNIGLEEAILLIAEQGRLTAINRNGVWLISPYRAEAAQLEPLKMETFTINYLPLDDELVKILRSLGTDRETVVRGKNKILIVRATADTIDSIRSTLLIMDRPTPQVLIEARIFQIADGDSSKIGIDWQDLGTETGFAIDGTWQDLSKSTIDWAYDAGDPTADPIVPASWNPTQTTTTLDGVQQSLDFKKGILRTAQYAYLNWSDFSVVLHALQTDSNAKQIANPKIVVNSDEQAFIHIGPQVPIVKRTVGSGDNAQTAFELDGDYGAEEVTEIDLGLESGSPAQRRSYTTNKGYLDLGTKLTVFPSVKTEEEVYLRVMPELVRRGRDRVFGAGTEGEVTYPELFRTFVRSQFTLRSGQTVAIGGLIDEDEREEQNGIPLLKDIPWLGKYLFSYKTKNTTRSETLIFLTVKVIAGKELHTSSGMPIRSSLMQNEIDRIQREDADGAEYNEQRARDTMEAAEAAEEAKLENRMNGAIKRLFGFDKQEVEASTAPPSYLEE